MPIPYAAKGRFDAACDKEILVSLLKNMNARWIIWK